MKDSRTITVLDVLVLQLINPTKDGAVQYLSHFTVLFFFFGSSVKGKFPVHHFFVYLAGRNVLSSVPPFFSTQTFSEINVFIIKVRGGGLLKLILSLKKKTAV